VVEAGALSAANRGGRRQSRQYRWQHCQGWAQMTTWHKSGLTIPLCGGVRSGVPLPIRRSSRSNRRRLHSRHLWCCPPSGRTACRPRPSRNRAPSDHRGSLTGSDCQCSHSSRIGSSSPGSPPGDRRPLAGEELWTAAEAVAAESLAPASHMRGTGMAGVSPAEHCITGEPTQDD